MHLPYHPSPRSSANGNKPPDSHRTSPPARPDVIQSPAIDRSGKHNHRQGKSGQYQDIAPLTDIDREFPGIIRQLQSMRDYSQQKGQMLPVTLNEDMLGSIITGMVSILVRSPRHVKIGSRQLKNLADMSESPGIALPEQLDRNSRINSLGSFMRIADCMKSGRKIVVLYAPRDTEFIFGDGFYHKNTGRGLGYEKRILMPLTPEIALLCVSGAKYRYVREIGDDRKEPDTFTYHLDVKDTVNLNCMLQLYAGKELFFRSSSYFSEDFVCKPFFSEKKLYFEYSDDKDDRVNDLVYQIPGIVKPKTDRGRILNF